VSVIDKLVVLVEKLHSETNDYIDNSADAQLWYNRGYSNGIVAYLIENNFADKLEHLALDNDGLYNNDHIMEWHKAYHHGFEMGVKESLEIHQAYV